MNRTVVISSCTQCPDAGFIETQDPNMRRVHVACDKTKRSFDFDSLGDPSRPIPAWCPLPNEKGETVK